MQSARGVPAGRKATVVRWTVRALAAIAIVFIAFVLIMITGEGQQRGNGNPPLPLVSKGAPFGTYAASTQLGMFTFVAGLALSLVGAIVAFRWRSVATWFLIAGGVIETFVCVIWTQDRTRPPGDMGAWIGLLLFALPPFALALLLVLLSRNRRHTEIAAGESHRTA